MQQPKRGWESHEREVNDLLGLDSTVHSGNRFHDPGDGVDRSRGFFALIADSKYTESHSKTVKLEELTEWLVKAGEFGKRFIMPLRFWPKDHLKPQDFVILSLHDFAELLEATKSWNEKMAQMVKAVEDSR